ncbi:MAG: glycosyltransferase family A protein [Nanoarchaeota archaeon]
MAKSKIYGKKPVISVIIPVYNDKKYLDEAIQGILNQTFRDFELILVNDASTDNSLEIMRKYQKKDKRIIIINNKKNLMTSRSRNKALKIAKGKYVAMQDHDDFSFPERLEKEYNFLEKNPDSFMVSCTALFVDVNGKFIFRIVNFFIEKLVHSVFSELPKKFISIFPLLVIHSSIMFRNTGQVFYRPKMIYSEDYDLHLRSISSGLKVSFIPETLVTYRLSLGMTSAKHFKIEGIMTAKAREFYRQRINTGKDDYSSFDPNSFIKDYENRKHSISEIISYYIFLFFGFSLNKILTHRNKKYEKAE